MPRKIQMKEKVKRHVDVKVTILLGVLGICSQVYKEASTLSLLLGQNFEELDRQQKVGFDRYFHEFTR